MKTCGVEIDNKSVIIVGLEMFDDGTFEICKHSTKVSLTEHESSISVKEFLAEVSSKLDAIGADSISILKRQMKGQFAAGGLSFKIEGLIQCYKPLEVNLISPLTVKAYLKKSPNPITAKYKYQQSALNVAFYLSSQS